MATSIFSRKRDLAYMIHFCISLPVMFMVDFQGLYPKELIPAFMKALLSILENTYHDQSFVLNEPFFRAFVWTELLYQLPVIIWSIRALYHDSPKVPIVLLPYSMLVFVTTATCIYEYCHWQIPTQHKIDLTTLYGPYLALSAFMFVDMSLRLNAIVNKITRDSSRTTKKVQ